MCSCLSTISSPICGSSLFKSSCIHFDVFLDVSTMDEILCPTCIGDICPSPYSYLAFGVSWRSCCHMLYARLVWKSGFSWKNNQLSNLSEYHFKKCFFLPCFCCWWLFSFVAFFVFANIVPSIKGQWGTWSLISAGQNTEWEQHGIKFWGIYLYITEMKQQKHTE